MNNISEGIPYKINKSDIIGRSLLKSIIKQDNLIFNKKNNINIYTNNYNLNTNNKKTIYYFILNP